MDNVNCINGKLEAGDFIICSPELPEHAYGIGQVRLVIPLHKATNIYGCDMVVAKLDALPFVVRLPAGDVARSTGLTPAELDALDSYSKRNEYYHTLCKDFLDARNLSLCDVDPARYPKKMPDNFCYDDTREDILRLSRQVAAITRWGGSIK